MLSILVDKTKTDLNVENSVFPIDGDNYSYLKNTNIPQNMFRHNIQTILEIDDFNVSIPSCLKNIDGFRSFNKKKGLNPVYLSNDIIIKFQKDNKSFIIYIKHMVTGLTSNRSFNSIDQKGNLIYIYKNYKKPSKKIRIDHFIFTVSGGNLKSIKLHSNNNDFQLPIINNNEFQLIHNNQKQLIEKIGFLTHNEKGHINRTKRKYDEISLSDDDVDDETDDDVDDETDDDIDDETDDDVDDATIVNGDYDYDYDYDYDDVSIIDDIDDDATVIDDIDDDATIIDDIDNDYELKNINIESFKKRIKYTLIN